MTAKRSRTILLIVFLLIIVISAIMSFIRFPSKSEIIYGGAGAAMAAVALYLSMHSLDVAESAQKDSSRSADAAKDSVKIAEDALEIAKSEADANALRYRIERGSFLALKKKDFLITILVPYSRKTRYDTTESLDAIHNPSSMLLENKGMGTATNISYSFHLLNDEDYRDLTFESNDVADLSALTESYYRSRHKTFPKYTFRAILFSTSQERTKLLVMFMDDQGNFSEKIEPEDTIVFQWYTDSPKSIQIGYLDHKEGDWIRLPRLFSALSHQYFLEQGILREEFRKTPKPRLLVRVYYSEEISEHMNRFQEAKRVKEFLITPSNNTQVKNPPADNPHDFTGLMLSCRYAIEALGDVPLSNDESEQTEVSTDGSTGPTEG